MLMRGILPADWFVQFASVIKNSAVLSCPMSAWCQAQTPKGYFCMSVYATIPRLN